MVTTFRSRLTVALASSTAAFLALFCLLLYLWCKTAFLDDLDGDLDAMFRADFAAVAKAGQAKGTSRPVEFGDFHVFKLILDPEGKLVATGSDLSEAPAGITPTSVRQVLAQGRLFGDLEYQDDLYRTLSTPVKAGSQTMVEVLGISQAPMQEYLDELKKVLLISFCIGILLVALVSHRVARYLTRPLEGILSQLETVAAIGDPSLRLSGTYLESEIAGLQREVNAVLERLDQSFRSQREFVSNASHELRAPLANLTLAIEVCLRRPRETEEYKQALETCHGEAERLTEMANQLLTLSKLDESVVGLEKAPVLLLSLLRECQERHAVAAQDRELRVEVEGEDLTLPVDAFKLGQVIDNLLDNAIRYSPQGSAVRCCLSKTESLVELSVSDRGAGMSAEQLERVFERFYRADPSRQRGTGGVGLGLAISRAIVEAHGGVLAVASAPGQGTIFTIRLPRS